MSTECDDDDDHTLREGKTALRTYKALLRVIKRLQFSEILLPVTKSLKNINNWLENWCQDSYSIVVHPENKYWYSIFHYVPSRKRTNICLCFIVIHIVPFYVNIPISPCSPSSESNTELIRNMKLTLSFLANYLRLNPICVRFNHISHHFVINFILCM